MIRFLLMIINSEMVPLQSYNQPLQIRETLNNSNLYNAMIYPFTRMVIYGAIWYQGRKEYSKYDTLFHIFVHR